MTAESLLIVMTPAMALDILDLQFIVGKSQNAVFIRR